MTVPGAQASLHNTRCTSTATPAAGQSLRVMFCFAVGSVGDTGWVPRCMALGVVLQARPQSDRVYHAGVNGLWLVGAEVYCRHRPRPASVCCHAPAAGNVLSSSPLALLVKRWMKVVT